MQGSFVIDGLSSWRRGGAAFCLFDYSFLKGGEREEGGDNCVLNASIRALSL